MMSNSVTPGSITGWIFGFIVLTIGLLNVFLVHPVPGIAYLLLSFIFLPPAYGLLKEKFGFFFPAIAKIILGVVMIWFTLGVSDLGDMIDKL